MPLRTLLAAAILVLTACVYAQVAGHAFVDWDDPAGIVDNPALRPNGPGEALAGAFGSTLNANWIPLTVLSLQASRALHGAEPAGYLLANVALHGAAAVLLFLALARMTGRSAPAFFVAAVFALHPLHVESVAWASARKDALSGLFFTAALLAHARHAEAPRRKGILLVLLCTAGALLSKPTAVTLPAVLLLLDYWPLGRLDRRAWLEKIPLLLLVAAASATTLAVQGSSRATSYGEHLSLLMRLLVGLESYAIYLGQTVWPAGLSYFYPHPATLGDVSPLPGASAALLVAGLTAGAFALRRSRPHLLVGWLWYLGTLVPVIGFVLAGAQAHADRYMYLPLVGLSIAAAWEADRIAALRPRARKALATTGIVAVLALAAMSWRQVGFWSDTISLKSHAVVVDDRNFVAHNGLGLALLRAGRLEEAEPHLRRAAQLNRGAANPLLDVADLAARRGRHEEALALYREVVRDHPGHARAQANLGLALLRGKRPAEARAHLERAVLLGRPHTVPPRRWASVELALARVCDAGSDLQCARRHYARSLENDPSNAAARRRLDALDR